MPAENQNLNKIDEDIASLREDMRRLKEDVGTTARDGWQAMGDQYQTRVDQTESCIRERPFMAVLTAAGAGFLLGFLFGRRGGD